MKKIFNVAAFVCGMDDDTLLEFIQQADAEMYQVKKTKKNHR